MTISLKPRAIKPEEIMLGGIWLGPGGGPHGDGSRPDLGQDNADTAVKAAISAGIREFDTAPWYGAGASEERLGRALTKVEGARVHTKTGRLFREPDGSPCLAGFDAPGRAGLAERSCVNDYSAAGAATSLAESLDRLGTSAFGLRIHDPNDNSNNRVGQPGFVDEVEQALAADGMVAGLRKLREEGTVAEIGLGMNCNREAHQGVPDEILRLLRGAPQGTFDSALLAGGWNLLTQEGLPCYAECEARGVAVHVAGVFCSGLLVGGDSYAYQKAPPHLVERAERWRELATKHGFSLPAVAIAFAALPTCVSRVVLGMATAEQIEANVKWVAEAALVGPAIWAEAQEAGLLGADLAVPKA